MATQTYHVNGMTCGHCAQAVTREVGALDGVEEVAVDIATGAVTVTSAAPLATVAVSSAVEEAGYTLVAGR